MSSNSQKIRLALTILKLNKVGAATAIPALRLLDGVPQDPQSLHEALAAIQDKLKTKINHGIADLGDAFDKADRIIEQCANHEIKIAVDGASPFADEIWKIPDPPVVLYYRGRLTEAVDQPGIAVIGTRDPTDFGYKSGKKIASRCAKQGLTVVSGLAIGCDTSAHEGAIEAGGFTIAVLAHGLDTVYPAANRKLATEIIDNGGLLVSEYPPGVEMKNYQLVKRDRLQSGLSRAVIVIETDIKGGTMHTAGFAKKQERMLACINHPVGRREDDKSRGNQKLIQEGATPIGSPEELQGFLGEVLLISMQTTIDPLSEPVLKVMPVETKMAWAPEIERKSKTIVKSVKSKNPNKPKRKSPKRDAQS